MAFWSAARRRSAHKSRLTARPSIEALESRLVPYSASGNAWANPQLITLSFVPDGTVLAQSNGSYLTSNLFATFDSIPGITSASQWQNIILKAAQSWAAQTNINFAVVADDGSPAGSGNYQQGAPNFGDIRIGGYNFGSSSNWLASTFYPPSVNNYSVAGDVSFNTGYSFNIGSTYDLFTVAEHEIGHALGLACSSATGSVMYTTYTGAVNGLGSDDIAGIRSVYSGGAARATDGAGTSFSGATNLTSSIDPTSLTAVANNLTISSTVNSQDNVTGANVNYFKFTAPANSASKMTVTVQSAGLSLLSPMMTVYSSSQTVLGTASGRGQYGTTLTVSNIAVTPGATYYVKVQGADNTVFSTGAYALTLNLGTGANPTVTPPSTQVANGSTLSFGGGVPMEPATNPNAGVGGGLLSPVGALLDFAVGAVGGLLGGLLGGGGGNSNPAPGPGPTASTNITGSGIPISTVPPPPGGTTSGTTSSTPSGTTSTTSGGTPQGSTDTTSSSGGGLLGGILGLL
jgi:hypothetical protein